MKSLLHFSEEVLAARAAGKPVVAQLVNHGAQGRAREVGRGRNAAARGACRDPVPHGLRGVCRVGVVMAVIFTDDTGQAPRDLR